MYVNCKFELKNKNMKIPLDIVADLFDACRMLIECSDYCVSYDGDGFRFSIREIRLRLDEDVPYLLENGCLGYRHLRAFFWLKRNTVYSGDSWNPCDFEYHPVDFFAYVEDIIRWHRK